jgi:hypothetical protein
MSFVFGLFQVSCGELFTEGQEAWHWTKAFNTTKIAKDTKIE